MESDVAVKALAALAQASRLSVFRALVVAGTEGLTPGSLSETLGVAPNTLSFHLKELVHADLVSQERSGRHLIYRAQFEHMDALLGFLTQNCCQGQACLPSARSCKPVVRPAPAATAAPAKVSAVRARISSEPPPRRQKALPR